MGNKKYEVIEDEGLRNRIKRTADVVSQVRYLEGKKENPLFSDPFAHLFVSAEAEQMLMLGLSRWPFFADYLSAREKFFDEQLKEIFKETSFTQLVILGSGNDMRAERLPFLKDKKIFEVDLPDKMAAKTALLEKTLGELPGQVAYVKADLSLPEFMTSLKQKGFDQKKKTAFLLQGLIYYLKPEGVDNLFNELMNVFKPGDSLLLDHTTEDMSQTKPYPVDLVQYLSEKGFLVTHHTSLGDLTAQYFGTGYPEKWWVVLATKILLIPHLIK
jgi:methyltransferase (TIGR00027 family)